MPATRFRGATMMFSSSSPLKAKSAFAKVRFSMVVRQSIPEVSQTEILGPHLSFFNI